MRGAFVLLVWCACACACAPRASVTGVQEEFCADPFRHRSAGGGARAELPLFNASSKPVLYFWNDLEGGRQLKGEIPTGEVAVEGTWAGHVFVVATDDLDCLGTVTVQADERGYVITDSGLAPLDETSRARFDAARSEAYVSRELQGVHFLVNRNALGHPVETDRLIDLVATKAVEARRAFPARWQTLLQDIVFWVEWDRRDSSQYRYQVKKDPSRSLENQKKWGAIEITSVRDADRVARFDQPSVLIHEYMHALHDHFSATERQRVTETWKLARAAHKLSDYANGNDGEFLADRAQAWLDVFSERPRTPEEVREQEPSTAKLMEDLLGPPAVTPALPLGPCVEPLPRTPSGRRVLTAVRFVNDSPRDVRTFFVDGNGELKFPELVPAGGALQVRSWEGFVTLVRDLQERCVGVLVSPGKRAEVHVR